MLTFKSWDKDNWKLLGILAYCFGLAYFAPINIARIGFLPLLFFAYRDKQNAVWLLLLLVFVDNPAYFFYGGEKMAIGRTPLYPFIGGGISFNELLAFTLILKSLQKRGTNLLYKRGLTLLVVVVIFSFFMSFSFNITTDSIVSVIRRLTMWILIFSIPKLFKQREDWLIFFKLLFPFIFLILIDQLFMFFSGKTLAGIFNPELKIYHAMREVVVEGEQISRAISGAVINFLIFSGAFLMLLNNELKKEFSFGYLFVLFFISYVTILFSATRGWIISYTVMFLMSLVIAQRKKLIRKITFYTLLSIVIFYITVSISPVLETQLNNVWIRLTTIEKIVQGDLSAGGTAGRWTDYMPRLLEYIRDNPLGYGFSATAFSLENDHVGIINPIITLGIIGYSFLLAFIFGVMYKLNRTSSRLLRDNPYRHSLLVLIIIFLGLFLIHSTSRQIFGLNLSINYNLLVAIVFAFANWIYIESIKYNMLIIRKTP